MKRKMEREVNTVKKWMSYPKWTFPLSFSSASVTGLGLDAKARDGPGGDPGEMWGHSVHVVLSFLICLF